MSVRALLLAGALGSSLASAAVRAQEGAPVEPRSQDTTAVPRIDPHRMEAALHRLARSEPPIRRVVRAATEVSAPDPDRASSLASRARLRGLVPVARAGVRRGQGQDLSELQSGDTTRLSTDDELALHATLTFELDRLVFSGEEVSLLREERTRRAARADVVREVVHLYFERRRLLLERALLAPDLEREIRIEEITALLDAFTGGAFSRMIGPTR